MRKYIQWNDPPITFLSTKSKTTVCTTLVLPFLEVVLFLWPEQWPWLRLCSFTYLSNQALTPGNSLAFTTLSSLTSWSSKEYWYLLFLRLALPKSLSSSQTDLVLLPLPIFPNQYLPRFSPDPQTLPNPREFLPLGRTGLFFASRSLAGTHAAAASVDLQLTASLQERKPSDMELFGYAKFSSYFIGLMLCTTFVLVVVRAGVSKEVWGGKKGLLFL